MLLLSWLVVVDSVFLLFLVVLLVVAVAVVLVLAVLVVLVVVLVVVVLVLWVLWVDLLVGRSPRVPFGPLAPTYYIGSAPQGLIKHDSHVRRPLSPRLSLKLAIRGGSSFVVRLTLLTTLLGRAYEKNKTQNLVNSLLLTANTVNNTWDL